MALPIGVSDVFKIFEFATGRKAERRERVIEWLDAVYSDLEELSQLWVKIMADTESADLQESKQALDILYSRGFDENLHLQRALAGRLLQFYLSATKVLGNNKSRRIVSEEDKNLFMFKLGSVLAARLKARNIVDDRWQFRFAERPVSLSLENAYVSLQDELVSLQVL